MTQSKTTFSVSWTASHAVIDGLLIRQTWKLIGGVCPDELEFPDDSIALEFVSPTTDSGLSPGACYRWMALGIDEEAQIAIVTSAPVKVVDITEPTIKSRSPRPSATGVPRTTSVRITFSEPVKGVSSTTLRLKNLRTGLWVRAKVSYSAATRTATLDPVLSMYRDQRYAVFVFRGVRDLSGNRLATATWSFRTRR